LANRTARRFAQPDAQVVIDHDSVNLFSLLGRRRTVAAVRLCHWTGFERSVVAMPIESGRGRK
jgi:hypothetical protein